MSAATPTPDLFADNPTHHVELDRLVNEDMNVWFPSGPQNNMEYAILLSLIVEHSDNQLCNGGRALRMLKEDSNLNDQLRDAWKSKSYRQIRNLGEFCP